MRCQPGIWRMVSNARRLPLHENPARRIRTACNNLGARLRPRLPRHRLRCHDFGSTFRRRRMTSSIDGDASSTRFYEMRTVFLIPSAYCSPTLNLDKVTRSKSIKAAGWRKRTRALVRQCGSAVAVYSEFGIRSQQGSTSGYYVLEEARSFHKIHA